MTGTVNIERMNEATLSHEELILLLHFIKADGIPGLDPDPIGDLNDIEKKRRLIYAERALRARNMARIDEDGKLDLREELLAFAAVCAFPQQSLVVQHFPQPGNSSRFFGHLRVGVVVAHTVPEAPLHHFQFCEGINALIDKIITFCSFPDQIDASIELPSTDLSMVQKIRTALADSRMAELWSEIDTDNAEEKNLSQLTTILKNPHALTVINGYSLLFDGEIFKQQVSFLHNEIGMWLILDQKELSNKVRFRSINAIDLKEMLSSWIEIPTLG